MSSPMGAATRRDADGFVSIADSMSLCTDLHDLCGGRLLKVAEAVRALPPGGTLVCDPEGRAIRLCGLLERLRTVAEKQVEEAEAGTVPLLDLLRTASVGKLLVGMPEIFDQLSTIRDAIGSSKLIQVEGSRVVLKQLELDAMAPAWQPGQDWPVTWVGASQSAAAGLPALPGLQGFQGDGSWFGPFGATGLADPRRGQMAGGPGDAAQPPDRRSWVCEEIAKLLEDPPAELAACMESDGSVQVDRVFAMLPVLAEKLQYMQTLLFRLVLMPSQHLVTGDQSRQTIRLKTSEERLVDACRDVLTQQPPGSSVLLEELLLLPAVRSQLAGAASSSSDGEASLSLVLEQALSASALFEVVDGPSGRAVARQPPGRVLHRTLEAVLDKDFKVRVMLSRDGAVPLAWLADQSLIRRMLPRAGVESYKATLDALRSAIELSSRYHLDDVRMTVRSTVPIDKDSVELSSGEAVRRHKWSLPLEKDVRLLRALLEFHFDFFNLQHNRLLMATVEAQFRKGKPMSHRIGYLRGGGLRPVFRLKDIRRIPRIARVFDQYGSEASPWLLASALQLEGRMPVRVCSKREAGASRGALFVEESCLELTYVPDLRFLESAGEHREVEWLRDLGSSRFTLQALPADLLCVVSYSVSSDLSHRESPKSEDVLEEILAGRLNSEVTAWERRQRKIMRQLIMYDPDIICVQGVQSIGFSERCSEWPPQDFFDDEQPASNHLVHLYRELSRLNYGVTFAPTMKMPGMESLCFGNAVFWKRSRWQVEQRWGVVNSAICIELKSRLGAPSLIVCSSKSAGAYAREWGDEMADDELIDAMGCIQGSLADAAGPSNRRLVWCGDFTMDPKALLDGLYEQAAATTTDPLPWRNACEEVLGEVPWTSASRFTAGTPADLILHCGGLRALAVLGGRQDQPSLPQLLRGGNPSDHLLQFAAFRLYEE